MGHSLQIQSAGSLLIRRVVQFNDRGGYCIVVASALGGMAMGEVSTSAITDRVATT